MNINILGIESSCDDTSAAVLQNGVLRSNVIASQQVHIAYGGVVPELASRAHQANIIPVADLALKKAGMKPEDIHGIAYTRGPGLMGSLLVGTSFAKGFSIARKIPAMDVNHLHAHILSGFVLQPDKPNQTPQFPFLSLLVSGGHTQIVTVRDYFEYEIIGQTIDDAAGEAFDKCAKVMGLGYPGGPAIDRLSKEGNPGAFTLSKPHIQGLDFSFSGLKTSFLYLVRDHLKENPRFIEENTADLCASLQTTICEILMDKLVKASKQTGIREICLGGGVSANSGLRNVAAETAKKQRWNLHLPELSFTTDNAAMVAIVGYYKYLRGEFASMDMTPAARISGL